MINKTYAEDLKGALKKKGAKISNVIFEPRVDISMKSENDFYVDEGGISFIHNTDFYDSDAVREVLVKLEEKLDLACDIDIEEGDQYSFASIKCRDTNVDTSNFDATASRIVNLDKILQLVDFDDSNFDMDTIKNLL